MPAVVVVRGSMGMWVSVGGERSNECRAPGPLQNLGWRLLWPAHQNGQPPDPTRPSSWLARVRLLRRHIVVAAQRTAVCACCESCMGGPAASPASKRAPLRRLHQSVSPLPPSLPMTVCALRFERWVGLACRRLLPPAWWSYLCNVLHRHDECAAI
jgi:hypothetical protein